MRNHYTMSFAIVKVVKTYEVTPCSDMREDCSSLSLVIVSTETIDQIMVVQHVDPFDQLSTQNSSIVTYIGMEELARPKALLRKILQ